MGYWLFYVICCMVVKVDNGMELKITWPLILNESFTTSITVNGIKEIIKKKLKKNLGKKLLMISIILYVAMFFFVAD